MKKMAMVVCILLSLAILLLFLQPRWYMKNTGWKPGKDITRFMTTLGDSALTTADVPVAALLLYNGQTIGAGYNTVRRNANAGGHAEINAISGAIKITGVDSFMKLNRDSMTLITTWEPCLMCRGAIAEYNIKHVIIMKAKPLHHWWAQWLKEIRYEWNKQAAVTDTLQESLFKKHPLYKQQKN